MNGMTKSLAREVGGAGGDGQTQFLPRPRHHQTSSGNNGPRHRPRQWAWSLDEIDRRCCASEAAIKRPNTVEEIAAVAVLLASKAGARHYQARRSAVDGGTAPVLRGS